MSENHNPNQGCEECGQIFVLKTQSGSCHKCQKLKEHAVNSPEYTEIETHPQCAACGVTRRNGMTPVGAAERCCGAPQCKRVLGDRYGKDLISQNIPETHADLADQTRKRFRLDVAPKKLPLGTHLNTASLLDHEHGGGVPGEDQICVAWTTRLKNAKSLNTDLGIFSTRLARSLLMPDVMNRMVSHVNIGWTRNVDRPPLEVSEASIRFAGNKPPLPNCNTITLDEFYKAHTHPDYASWYFDVKSIPTHFRSLNKNHKIPLLPVELYIDTEVYNNRVDEWHLSPTTQSAVGSITQSHKRGRSKGSMLPPSEVSSKRVKNASGAAAVTSLLPASTFRASQRTGPAVIKPQSEIVFDKLLITLDPVNGNPDLERVQRGLTARICDIPFQQGTMKLAFEITLANGERKVAKRFFKLHEESDSNVASDLDLDHIVNNREIPVKNSEIQIQAEAERLALGSMFLKQFLKTALTMNVDVYKNIKFADAFLAKETGDSPSPASGIKVKDPVYGGVTWLVEDKRPTVVQKFTGTLSHKRRRDDLASLTVDAFTHFAFGHSNSSIVFADLQATPSRVNGEDGLTLFDPMTHTKDGTSGVGDFGKEGMESLFQDHKCGRICSQMTLDTSYSLRLPEDLENDPEDDDDSLDIYN